MLREPKFAAGTTASWEFANAFLALRAKRISTSPAIRAKKVWSPNECCRLSGNKLYQVNGCSIYFHCSTAIAFLTVSTIIATINVEKPKANEIASRSNREKMVSKSPRKRIILTTNNPIPAFIRPLPANGVRIQATPKLSSKKLMPMKIPPISSAFASSHPVCQSAANKPMSRSPCQSSIRRMVFFAAASISLRREKLDPTYQSYKRPDKSRCRAQDQKPRRTAEISIRNIANYQATNNGTWQFEGNS